MALFGAEHVERYLATDGEQGYEWRNGTTILILTTKGRKTGKKRQHALIFRGFGDDYLVVASKGGADQAPEWFQNLEHDPHVEVQDKFQARARVATEDEKPQMWNKMTEVWPDYDEYQRKTDREIPVVVLERL